MHFKTYLKGGEKMNADIMNEKVTCKWCGESTLYGEMMWLNGKCMCPKCYFVERAIEDSKRRSEKNGD